MIVYNLASHVCIPIRVEPDATQPLWRYCLVLLQQTLSVIATVSLVLIVY